MKLNFKFRGSASCLYYLPRSTGRPGADGDAIDVDADDPDRAIDVDTNKYAKF